MHGDILDDDSSSRVTWKNLSAPSLIELTRCNENDLHPIVSSEPLIEDEEPNPMATPKSTYKYTLFDDVNHSRVFQVIKLFGHLNP